MPAGPAIINAWSRPSRHAFLGRGAPLAFAHRGGAGEAPENTLPAFERAVALGYRYRETDVHLTRDGVLVAFHDARLDRVTDRGGAIAELDIADVEAADAGHAFFALNLLALLNDLMFGTDPPGHLPRRRQAKFVRRMLLCVPARVIDHAHRIILRLPDGLPSAPAFQAASAAARGLSEPAPA
jgi:hypothetical protein